MVLPINLKIYGKGGLKGQINFYRYLGQYFALSHNSYIQPNFNSRRCMISPPLFKKNVYLFVYFIKGKDCSTNQHFFKGRTIFLIYNQADLHTKMSACLLAQDSQWINMRWHILPGTSDIRIKKLQSKMAIINSHSDIHRERGSHSILYTQLCQVKVNRNFFPPQFPESPTDCFHTKTWNKDEACPWALQCLTL